MLIDDTVFVEDDPHRQPMHQGYQRDLRMPCDFGLQRGRAVGAEALHELL